MTDSNGYVLKTAHCAHTYLYMTHDRDSLGRVSLNLKREPIVRVLDKINTNMTDGTRFIKTFCISNFIFSDWWPKYCNLKYILQASSGSLLLSLLDGS